MLTFFRPRTKDFGAALVRMAHSINLITASATDTFGLGGISDKDDTAQAPGHTAYVDEIIVSAQTVPVGGGTIIGALKKYDSSAAAAVTLASAIDLEALTAGKAERIAFDSGVTDQQRILDFGDTLYFESVQSGTVTTQPAMAVAVLIKFLT